ncbi:hypothetical protein [Ferrimicrobium acidiphilum]|uniref:hypothetical protein n=1 Tax=Ferrimicrobium acidiphilum TaxID=121039 RepID=UPI0023F3A6DC|nr:hypothetical protein [Ferrimicrobium acidiphilum]
MPKTYQKQIIEYYKEIGKELPGTTPKEKEANLTAMSRIIAREVKTLATEYLESWIPPTEDPETISRRASTCQFKAEEVVLTEYLYSMADMTEEMIEGMDQPLPEEITNTMTATVLANLARREAADAKHEMEMEDLRQREHQTL